MGKLGIKAPTKYCVKQWPILPRQSSPTVADDSFNRPEDKVKRQSVAVLSNQLWVEDITFVATWAGFVYVAFITDVFARYIAG